MKRIILAIILYFSCSTAFAQKINGQWRGYFDSKGDIVLSGANNTEYVLELEINAEKVTGFSYSYFQGRKYYVICKLTGTYYKSSKSIKVVETERIKGNTPPDFTDCFQVHFLTYEKEGKAEKLTGRWETAPGQLSSCGGGSTTLTRRTLDKDLSSFKKQSQSNQTNAAPKKDSVNKTNLTAKANPKLTPSKKTTTTKNTTTKNTTAGKEPKTTSPPVTKNTAKPKTSTAIAPPPVAKIAPIQKETTKPVAPEPKKTEINAVKTDFNFEKRKTDILKTIEIENETFKVDLYDNGEVDGDSVSLFYNGKLILSHNRLSEKPITLTLDATTENAVNELTMYAENLGEIPPNTALMVITDGDKRYEARISSDLKNSGTIHFIHKLKTQ